jgi:hypothetical protein
MPLRFSFKEPLTMKGAAKADPQKIGEELTRIAAENGGRLEPKPVVEAARKRSSAMHTLFEWRDQVAADKYRLDQARELIRIIRIENTDKPDEPARRAFLNVQDNGHSYRTVDEVLGSSKLQLAVLIAAERELNAFEQRYSELAEICSYVRQARQQLAARIAAQQGGEAAA